MRKRALLGGFYPSHGPEEWPSIEIAEETLKELRGIADEAPTAEMPGSSEGNVEAPDLSGYRSPGLRFPPLPALEGDDRSYGEIRPFVPASWFHEVGIYKVIKRLEPRLPDVGGKLFLTFTTDPKLFQDAESAFECSRDHLRKVFYRLRKGVQWEGKKYQIDEPYCVKVEFHENGWAHFHVIFLTRRFLPGELLNEIWGHGRTNVARISQQRFRYLLKYVTKGDTLPDWILQRKRLRVFQSSRGFLLPAEGRKASRRKPKEEAAPAKESSSIGERLEKWRCTGILRELDRHRPIQFAGPYSEVVGAEVLSAAKAGCYRGRQIIEFKDEWEIEQFLQQHP